MAQIAPLSELQDASASGSLVIDAGFGSCANLKHSTALHCRVLRSNSIAELSRANLHERGVEDDEGGPSTRAQQTSAEFWHILAWTAKLWPTVLLVTGALGLNEMIHYWVHNADPRFQVLLSFGITVTSFAVSIWSVLRFVDLSWLDTVQSLLVLASISALSVGAATSGFRFPWTPAKSIIFLSAVIGISVVGCLSMAQILERSSAPCGAKVHIVAWTVGAVTSLAALVILGYGFLVHAGFETWLNEWLVSGVAFPTLSVVVGRLLVADFVSFALLWAFPRGSCRAVMSFFSFCVKIHFHFASQKGILLLETQSAFALAVAVATVSEVMGTYLNVRLNRVLHKRASDCKGLKPSQNIFSSWLTLRSTILDEKLVLHAHDEAVGEKLVVLAAVAARLFSVYGDSLSATMTSDEVAAATRKVALHGSVLFVVELIQDFLQRSVLLRVGGLTTMIIKPRHLSAAENASITGFILMTVNFFEIAAQLVALRPAR